MKTLNGMFLSKYDLLNKYLVADEMKYLEEKYIRLQNHADVDY